MTRDIMLAFGADGLDLHVAAGDLMTDDTLTTAVIISLFTDRQADLADELPDAGQDRKGWWADATLPEHKAGGADRIGSRLWLLAREKQLDTVVERARAYGEEALAWLADDGHVRAVSVSATNPARCVLLLRATMTLHSDDEATVAAYYDYASNTYALTA